MDKPKIQDIFFDRAYLLDLDTRKRPVYQKRGVRRLRPNLHLSITLPHPNRGHTQPVVFTDADAKIENSATKKLAKKVNKTLSED